MPIPHSELIFSLSLSTLPLELTIAALKPSSHSVAQSSERTHEGFKERWG